MMIGIGKARGFSLISTLFILVVLAVLGGYMARMSSVQHTSSAMSIQSARAWFAVLSGLEWAVYRINNDASCAAGNGPQCCSDIQTAAGTGFDVSGFTITLTQCDQSGITEGATHYTLYNIGLKAEAGSFGSTNYVSRSLTAMVSGN